MLRKISTLLLFGAFFGPGSGVNQSGLEWWQRTILYEIYPRSYQDSDGNGVGDLKGIESRLNYINETGIGTIWLTPIYQSPMSDLGYDISNFTAIDPLYGTMEDFYRLRDKIHSMGMYLVLDFVPNHTSNRHPWFIKSRQKIYPYTDYYIWKDPAGWINETTPIPPNNWLSVFQGSAWEFVPERGQYYFHQFLKEQVDLNYRNDKVLEEMKNVMRFWLDRGVNGFRCDAVAYLIENSTFADEPPVNNSVPPNTTDYDSLRHIYTIDQPENYGIIRQFRKVADSYTRKGGPTRIIITEAYTNINLTIAYYGTYTKPIAQVPFNFKLLTNLNTTSTAQDYYDTVYLWLDNMPKGRTANWVIGNHDRHRVSTRFSDDLVDAFNMQVLLLPGTSVTYYGEEIGMTDTKITEAQSSDRKTLHGGPDVSKTSYEFPERSPFQWNCQRNAGFSNTTGPTWLPVNSNYRRLNLALQQRRPKSHYNNYKKMAHLRSTQTIRLGNFNAYVCSKWIFAFERSLPGAETYIMVINLSTNVENAKLSTCIPQTPKKLKVYVASTSSEHDAGDQLNTSGNGFTMKPKSSMVLQKCIPER